MLSTYHSLALEGEAQTLLVEGTSKNFVIPLITQLLTLSKELSALVCAEDPSIYKPVGQPANIEL